MMRARVAYAGAIHEATPAGEGVLPAHVREHKAFLGAVLELLHQADDHHRLFHQRAFADETAGHAKLVFCFGIDDLEIGPVSAAQNPLIVFHVHDGRIK